MHLVYIGLLVLMCSVSLSIFNCTLYYIGLKLSQYQKLLNEQEIAKKKASEKSEFEEKEIFKD